MINHEIKAQLAKLLATEDLVVEHKNIGTAQFDVEKRILTLPIWNKASNIVYDMLVGHEVGHALFTPNEWDYEVPRGIVNVTEDARIEKLMKRKYPGLHKSFNGGYEELAEQDFFSIEDKDIESMNLADRINLYFKIGKFVDIPFNTDEECRIVKLVGDAETFSDAIAAAEEIYSCMKQQIEEEKELQNAINQALNQSSGQSSSEGLSSDIADGEQDGEQDGEEIFDVDGSDVTEDVESEKNNLDEFEIETDNAFKDGTKDLTSQTNLGETFYAEIPKVHLDKVIISNNKIHNELNEYWERQSIPLKHEDGSDSDVANFGCVDKFFQEFKKSAQKEVNYLVKEFETRKSADSYSRSSVSRTGVLDTSKLHTYKFNEDLFKKITIVPDGKNHGLIFVLDWSGSMRDVMLSTIKQLYNLIWFCDKVNIPFDVYAFTNSYFSDDLESENMDFKSGVFYVDKTFKLMNLITSTSKRKDLDIQLKNIWRVVYTFNTYQNYFYPRNFNLSGTPLNESLVSIHQIIPAFKKKHGTQKVQCIILTDGEASQLPTLGKYTHFLTGEEKIGGKRFNANVIMRNRKTGCTYNFSYHYTDFTEVLLNDLRKTFEEVNFVGIRIISGRDFNYFVKHHDDIEDFELKLSKKKGFHFIKNSGYDSYIALLDSSLDNDDEMHVEEGASKAKIKSAFIKSLKSKALNKKVLNHFVKLVA